MRGEGPGLAVAAGIVVVGALALADLPPFASSVGKDLLVASAGYGRPPRRGCLRRHRDRLERRRARRHGTRLARRDSRPALTSGGRRGDARRVGVLPPARSPCAATGRRPRPRAGSPSRRSRRQRRRRFHGPARLRRRRARRSADRGDLAPRAGDDAVSPARGSGRNRWSRIARCTRPVPQAECSLRSPRPLAGCVDSTAAMSATRLRGPSSGSPCWPG